MAVSDPGAYGRLDSANLILWFPTEVKRGHFGGEGFDDIVQKLKDAITARVPFTINRDELRAHVMVGQRQQLQVVFFELEPRNKCHYLTLILMASLGRVKSL